MVDDDMSVCVKRWKVREGMRERGKRGKESKVDGGCEREKREQEVKVGGCEEQKRKRKKKWETGEENRS